MLYLYDLDEMNYSVINYIGSILGSVDYNSDIDILYYRRSRNGLGFHILTSFELEPSYFDQKHEWFKEHVQSILFKPKESIWLEIIPQTINRWIINTVHKRY